MFYRKYMQRSDYLVWIDLEMTGLNPLQDAILEIAVVITDNNLNVIAQGPDFIIHQTDEVLDAMREPVKTIHHVSALSQESRNSSLSVHQAEQQVLEFLQQYCKEKTALLCGNSVWMDKAFLAAHMPTLHAFFNYRIIDVSSLKELAKRWYPHEKFAVEQKSEQHRALKDILESIEELRHYKKVLFK